MERGNCDWPRYERRFLRGAAACEAATFDYDQIEAAQVYCEMLGDLCSGVTCQGAQCIPRMGRELEESPNDEVTWLKLCGPGHGG